MAGPAFELDLVRGDAMERIRVVSVNELRRMETVSRGAEQAADLEDESLVDVVTDDQQHEREDDGQHGEYEVQRGGRPLIVRRCGAIARLCYVGTNACAERYRCRRDRGVQRIGGGGSGGRMGRGRGRGEARGRKRQPLGVGKRSERGAFVVLRARAR